MADIVLLKKQRKLIKQSFTRMVNYCNQDNVTISQIAVRATRADELLSEYEAIQNQIDALVEDENLEHQIQYRSEIEEAYFHIKAAYASMLESSTANIEQQVPAHDNTELAAAIHALTQNQTSMSAILERFTANVQVENASTPTVNIPNQPIEFQLPRIQLPDFDGNLLEWIRFKELFEALVHNKANLADVQKLEYLQSKLKGEALTIIKHLRPTNSNYTVAWELLKNKYDNVEKVKNAYMELLFDQPQMKASTLTETKRFLNNINEGYNAIKALDDTTSQWSSILLFSMEKKLDSNTATLWYREKGQDGVTFDTFLKFLEKRIFELESLQASHHNVAPQSQAKRAQARTYTATVRCCPVCAKQHLIFQCEAFKNMAVDQRRDVIQKHGLCFNCLRDSHRANSCKSSSCKKCNKKHNTLLHMPNNPETVGANQTSSEIQPTVSSVYNNAELSINEQTSCVSTNMAQETQQTMVILPTAIINVIDGSGAQRPCRALLDSGSQGTLITEECVQRLQLRKMYDKTLIYGLASKNGNQTRGKVELQIKADNENKSIITEALCLPKLTQLLPAFEINSEQFEYFKKLYMADSNWNKPRSVDIILGADVFMECCLSQKITHPKGYPTALNTIFGWVLMGKVDSPQARSIVSNHITLNLDQQLQRFWETEEVSDTAPKLSPEEAEAEQLYANTTQRDVNGRYVVRLPIKNKLIDIGDSRHSAVKRLMAMERKFKNNARMEVEYKRFMNEYIQLGHMEPVAESSSKNLCFLPHHAVEKPSSTTTKLRVVFDASNKTTNGKSLNDNLLVGPKVQRDLFDMLITFRIHSIAFTGDIEKMYRQVLVHTDDRHLQCILWREHEAEPIKAYMLNTVTYGTAAASFLATRTLNQVAKDNHEAHPGAAEIIEQNFYVDDLMCSVPNLQQALCAKDDIRTILSSAGFHIRKWSCNTEDFLVTIDNQDRANSTYTELQSSNTVSTLGIIWETTNDNLQYSTNIVSTQQQLTKRFILSAIARVYDPMGWIAPIIVGMKIFMQKLWLKGVSWDEQLPPDLADQWSKFHDSISNISKIKINRWIQYTPESTIELHGFSDASERAYAAVVYVKISVDNEIYTHLIASKTRVAPVKQISLPRLELCGAHLLVKLLLKVRNSLNMPNIAMYGWTDSTIVLAWLSDHPCRWKTFIANRSAQIINEIPAQQWHHISTHNNPADLATRGVATDDLISNELWWNGPRELHQDMATLPTHHQINIEDNMEERKNISTYVVTNNESNFIDKYDSLTKLIRTTALMLRFTHNCKHKQQKRTGFLTTLELRAAHNQLIKAEQQKFYAEELKTISAGRALPNSHHLSSVVPFMDDSGLLRVGGRITNANVSFNQKHPLILHKQGHLTKLIIRFNHLQHCHAGKRLLYYILHLQYWIPRATSVIKSCIYKCVSCMRQRAKPFKQQMADLPVHRLSPAPAFSKVAIDFAGTVQVRAWKGRGKQTYKCWIAVFICLVTKAIHVDVVTEISTNMFMACLRRFISRRGKPAHIYSDNGTNFLGAFQKLKKMYKFLGEDKTQKTICNALAEQGIQWHFSPPSGPHFGGLWEAGVKSVKIHLYRVLKDAYPTYEEMYTILCQIESCVNSRPLCLKFEGDLDPLTPAHFLILRPIVALPEEDYTSCKENRLARWEYIQRLVQQFWKKWSHEYLHQLQQRNKWKQKCDNIKLNDVVLIKEENTAPSHWQYGIVIQLHPGQDGLVRVATIKTTKGQLKRPIVKLCPLIVEQ